MSNLYTTISIYCHMSNLYTNISIYCHMSNLYTTISIYCHMFNLEENKCAVTTFTVVDSNDTHRPHGRRMYSDNTRSIVCVLQLLVVLVG